MLGLGLPWREVAWREWREEPLSLSGVDGVVEVDLARANMVLELESSEAVRRNTDESMRRRGGAGGRGVGKSRGGAAGGRCCWYKLQYARAPTSFALPFRRSPNADPGDSAAWSVARGRRRRRSKEQLSRWEERVVDTLPSCCCATCYASH